MDMDTIRGCSVSIPLLFGMNSESDGKYLGFGQSCDSNAPILEAPQRQLSLAREVQRRKHSAGRAARRAQWGEHSGESAGRGAESAGRRAEGVAQRAQLIMQRARRIRLGGRDRESMAGPTKRALLAAGLVDWRKFGQYVTRKLSLLC